MPTKIPNNIGCAEVRIERKGFKAESVLDGIRIWEKRKKFETWIELSPPLISWLCGRVTWLIDHKNHLGFVESKKVGLLSVIINAKKNKRGTFISILAVNVDNRAKSLFCPMRFNGSGWLIFRNFMRKLKTRYTCNEATQIPDGIAVSVEQGISTIVISKEFKRKMLFQQNRTRLLQTKDNGVDWDQVACGLVAFLKLSNKPTIKILSEFKVICVLANGDTFPEVVDEYDFFDYIISFKNWNSDKFYGRGLSSEEEVVGNLGIYLFGIPQCLWDLSVINSLCYGFGVVEKMEEFPEENGVNGHLKIVVFECSLLRMSQMRRVEFDGVSFLGRFVPVSSHEVLTPSPTLEEGGETPEQSSDHRRIVLYRSPTPQDSLSLDCRGEVGVGFNTSPREDVQEHSKRRWITNDVGEDSIHMSLNSGHASLQSINRTHISNSFVSDEPNHGRNGLDLNSEPEEDVEISSRCQNEIVSSPWLVRESGIRSSVNTETLLLQVGALDDLEDNEGFQDDSSVEGTSDADSMEDPEDFMSSPSRKKKGREFQVMDLEEIRKVVLPLGIRLGLSVTSKDQEDRVITQLAGIEAGKDGPRQSQRKSKRTWRSQKLGESLDSSKSNNI